MRHALLLAAAAALTAACSGAGDEGAGEERAAQAAGDRVEVAVDGGTEEVVGTAPVQAVVPPGATLALRSASTGTSVTHLFTSAAPGQAPTVFTSARGGAVPNGAVWGYCLGGAASPASRTCPVPPVEGPADWDGRDYVSLGAVLPGETRELRLSDALEPGQELQLWCRLHPTLSVQLTVGEQPSAPPAPEVPAPPPAAEATTPVEPAEVVVAPLRESPAGELLRYEPSAVTVRAGGTVTWRAASSSPHTVEIGGEEPDLEHSTPADSAPSAPDGAWDGAQPVRSGYLSTDPGAPGGAAFTLRFGTPGTYEVRCRFHPSMRGVVTVVA